MNDPIGPGTKAWEHADRAIDAGIAGNAVEQQSAIDAMTRELLSHGATVGEIRQWEACVAEQIAEAA